MAMDNINVNFFGIKNYANILDGHFIGSRVDYMDCGMGKKGINGNTTKIDGIIGMHGNITHQNTIN